MIDRFIHGIEGLNAALPVVKIIMDIAGEEAQKEYLNYLKDNGTLVAKRPEDYEVYNLPPESYLRASRLRRKHERTRIGSELIPAAFLISLISQYDAFLGDLLRAILHSALNSWLPRNGRSHLHSL